MQPIIWTRLAYTSISPCRANQFHSILLHPPSCKWDGLWQFISWGASHASFKFSINQSFQRAVKKQLLCSSKLQLSLNKRQMVVLMLKSCPFHFSKCPSLVLHIPEVSPGFYTWILQRDQAYCNPCYKRSLYNYIDYIYNSIYSTYNSLDYICYKRSLSMQQTPSEPDSDWFQRMESIASWTFTLWAKTLDAIWWTLHCKQRTKIMRISWRSSNSGWTRKLLLFALLTKMFFFSYQHCYGLVADTTPAKVEA